MLDSHYGPEAANRQIPRYMTSATVKSTAMMPMIARAACLSSVRRAFHSAMENGRSAFGPALAAGVGFAVALWLTWVVAVMASPRCQALGPATGRRASPSD